jgi:hypothetical protein
MSRVGVIVIALGLAGCSPADDQDFEALQERGQVAMGVDQYTSTHRFDDLSDGGRIELQRDDQDSRDIATIRTHLKEVAAAFARGDFNVPGFVHAQEVPGTKVMAAKKSVIRYEFEELPKGGEIRITTSDPEALRAIHEFLAFQRMDHRAAGHTH